MVRLLPILGLIALAVTACGGGEDSGELLIGDNVSFTVGGDAKDLKFGVAVPAESATGAFTVYLSTRGVDCMTTSDSARGDYVTFDPMSATPMDYPSQYITVVHANGTHFYLNGSSGHVEITSVTEASVAGSIAHTDDADDGPISANGTFEVVRCF